MKENILLILTIILLQYKITRFFGYIGAIYIVEISSATLGYNEQETCLNSIIWILLFILFELWNKFRKDK